MYTLFVYKNTNNTHFVHRRFRQPNTQKGCSYITLCIHYSLWSLILTTLYSTQKIFHGKFQNWKITTQALSVYRKGTFHIYIKCLIVISWKVTIKNEVQKKGHTLAYQFE